MDNKYICVGFGVSPKNGKEYSKLAKIVEFQDKQKNAAGFIDLKKTVYCEDILPIGEVKFVETNIL